MIGVYVYATSVSVTILSSVQHTLLNFEGNCSLGLYLNQDLAAVSVIDHGSPNHTCDLSSIVNASNSK